MRVRITVDDELGKLIEKARACTGVDDLSALANEGLKALIEREETKRLRSPHASTSDDRPG